MILSPDTVSRRYMKTRKGYEVKNLRFLTHVES